jgi:hypothetical protein
MLKTRTRTAPVTGNQEQLIRQLRTEIAELTAERDELRRCFEGSEDKAMWWSLAKVARQRDALGMRCSRATRWHFEVRELNRLGRGLTREEYQAARGRLDEMMAGRVGDWEAA